jgi:hypothetical protein
MVARRLRFGNHFLDDDNHAPAAKASAYGRIGRIASTAVAPMTAATGSTQADI